MVSLGVQRSEEARLLFSYPFGAHPPAKVVFRFQSIGGRWYQSTTTINNRVLTKFAFEAVKA